MKKIAVMADTYHIPFCPHNYLGPIPSVASVQACTCAPHLIILEFQGGDVPWSDDVLIDPVPLENGFIEIPRKPGLGVELDKVELRRHLVD